MYDNPSDAVSSFLAECIRKGVCVSPSSTFRENQRHQRVPGPGLPVTDPKTSPCRLLGVLCGCVLEYTVLSVTAPHPSICSQYALDFGRIAMHCASGLDSACLATAVKRPLSLSSLCVAFLGS